MKTWYKITLKHDAGNLNISLPANSIVEAVELACQSECCPLSACIAAKEIKNPKYA